MSPTSDLDDPTKVRRLSLRTIFSDSYGVLTDLYLSSQTFCDHWYVPRHVLEWNAQGSYGPAPANKVTASSSKGPAFLNDDEYGVQLEAYERAWSKCLERVQTIAHALQSPVVAAIRTSIDDAYSKDVLPGLPFVELPVIAVSAPGGSHSVIADVVANLEARNAPSTHKASRKTRSKGKSRVVEEDEGEDVAGTARSSLVAHVYPEDCTNVASTMKAIIIGLVDRQEEDEEEEEEAEEGKELDVRLPEAMKRKPTTSLASFDINLLKVWYKALTKLNDTAPQLVVVLHEFEQLDPSVIQDVFYICNKSIPQLPLIFLLDSSAPSTMAYLHAAYTRATIALLRVRIHSAPSGVDLINTVIDGTFFNPDFEPDIMLGPAVLDFLGEFSARHTNSIDAALTILQLAHMKHFEELLTCLVPGFPSAPELREAATRLRQTSSFTLVDSLLTRLWSESTPDERYSSTYEVPQYLEGVDWSNPSVETLLSLVESARQDFRYRATHMRLGYQLVKTVQRFMRSHNYKTSTSVTGQEDSELSFMSRAVRGRVSRDIKHLALMIRKLPSSLLDALLGDAYSLFFRLQSTELRQEQTAARDFLVRARDSVRKEAASEGPDVVKKASAEAPGVSEWFSTYVEQHLVRLDQSPLWELWNTGNTPFPSELINPAPRAAVVNALLHPHDVLDAHRELFLDGESSVSKPNQVQNTEERPDWELPDTSILFRRYMEAGKLINVYDLYESFAAALDAQKEHTEKVQSEQKNSPAKGKEKKRAVEVEEEAENEEERWGVEVHARFIRAFHELDYMGFIKHTGRKADHVFRTVYDIPD
ncbi:hypothetical protein BDW22DRAFT_1395357 [Trametopsis cervina]|nr:hypothetical protein BDW22DRAFT_1395357 [Trametopsis cervina]